MKKRFLPLLLLTPPLLADFNIQSGLEVHSKYQNLDLGLKDVIVYPRLEIALNLPQTWQLYLRFEIPYIWLWGKTREQVSIDQDGIVVAPETPGATTKMKKTSFSVNGNGDSLARFFFVTPLLGASKRTYFGFGSEFTFPTAQKDDIGTGKYSARPIIGVKYDFSDLGNGSWFGLFAKYQFSFAGDKDRLPFQIFFLQPVFVYTFGNNWSLASTPEIQYNVLQKNWFVPLTASISKGFGKHFACSLAYQKGVITDFPVFQDEVELTLRYTF